MKRVTLDEEAYAILTALRIDPQDSFSNVVNRHLLRSRSIHISSGTWSDMTDAEVGTLRRETLGVLSRKK